MVDLKNAFKSIIHNALFTWLSIVKGIFITIERVLQLSLPPPPPLLFLVQLKSFHAAQVSSAPPSCRIYQKVILTSHISAFFLVILF